MKKPKSGLSTRIVLLIAFIFCLFGLIGVGTGIYKPSSIIGFAEEKNGVACPADMVTVSVPSIINSQNQSAFPITGTGVPNLALHYQIIAGVKDISGNVITDALGNFSFTVDLSGFPEGTINFTVFQNIDECESVMAFAKAEKNTIIPPSPNFSVKCITNDQDQPFLDISGTTVANGIIHYIVSDSKNDSVSGSVMADASGNFSINKINISGLLPNISVCLSATDSFGNSSSQTCQSATSCAAGGRGGGAAIVSTAPILPETGPNYLVSLVASVLSSSIYGLRLRKSK